MRRWTRRCPQTDDGFTLIELLIVIVILGIIAAIVIFAVQNLGGSSVQASCRSDFKTVEDAVEAYRSQLGEFPTGLSHLGRIDQEELSPYSSASVTPPATDVDWNAAPNFRNGLAPSGINAAGTWAGPRPATGGGELTSGSNVWKTTDAGFSAYEDQSGNTTNNLTYDATNMTVAQASRAGVGPWLKDVPQSQSHYTIWVANDGSGEIAVLDGIGKVVQDPAVGSLAYNDANACSEVH